ncbi:Lon protease [Bifidobacterium pullorum subsp. saeculare]|uniref:endopeptidase La n=1 Tax=Bifidobacterium pullorum subsp. saeculare TaxID=78257 RepID=A0A939B9T4_9BIFI|nr:S16 family serine protease [Bifidobacterium pullorum]MBM6699171.1 Lon protease [Bifidobacterium pullorum subsp. saeculare]
MPILRRLHRYFAARSARCLAGLAAVALAVVMLCLPGGYTVEWPGPTQDVLGESGGRPVIAVKGAETHRDSGRLLLVTVTAEGVPGYPVTAAQTLWAWFDPQQVVLPSEAVVPIGESGEEYADRTARQMASSQDKAVAAAFAFMRGRGMAVPDGATATMHVDEIGGPSAGLMYALGLVDKLTATEETGGHTIAGTGTIARDGKVGAIGGIRLKMLGAKRDGATWFLAPAANCDEVVGHVPQGLRDVRVSTLAEAYDALVAIGKGQGDSLPHCAVDDSKR